MGNHYLIPFKCAVVQESAADIADFNADVARTGTFTQTLTPDVEGVKRGILTNVLVFCDSANNTTFDLIISEGNQANDQASQSDFIFDSQVELGADIADATEQTFEVYHAFVLEDTDVFYFTLDHSAAAGNCLGRIAFWGLAFY